MKFDFDFSEITHQELVVSKGDSEFSQLIIDKSVRSCLQAMLEDTADRFEPFSYSEIPNFEPAEKYGAEELVKASLADSTLANLLLLFNLAGVPANNDVINDIFSISYYLYKVKDSQNRQLVGVRKAQQMKGLAGAHGRIVSLIDDSLTIMEKPVFKLDREFDLIITSTEVFAIRPNTLAYVAEVDEAATQAAQTRLNMIGEAIDFLSLEVLQPYVSTRKRAAHLVSAIANRSDLSKFQKAKLESACQELGIQIQREPSGKVGPLQGHEMAFLELLDNRRYVTSLTEDPPIAFVAASRRPVNAKV